MPADLFWEPVKGLYFALGLVEEPNENGVQIQEVGGHGTPWELARFWGRSLDLRL